MNLCAATHEDVSVKSEITSTKIDNVGYSHINMELWQHVVFFIGEKLKTQPTWMNVLTRQLNS